MDFKSFVTRIIAIIAVTAIFGLKSGEINAGDPATRLAEMGAVIDAH